MSIQLQTTQSVLLWHYATVGVLFGKFCVVDRLQTKFFANPVDLDATVLTIIVVDVVVTTLLLLCDTKVEKNKVNVLGREYTVVPGLIEDVLECFMFES